MNRKYRVWFHYYKQRGKMSVHFRGACFVVDDVDCQVPCNTKWNPTQPRLVLQGWAWTIEILNNKALII